MNYQTNMKTLALDIGDVWTGTALSDASGFFAKPYQTVTTAALIPFLQELFQKENINTVVIGHPRTMKGTASEQTKKVEQIKTQLEQQFSGQTFILWDERLSSKRAQALKQAKTKDEKIKSHSIAAAFILENYLQFAKPTTTD
jgi:putative holliday junction resolvase